MERTEAMDATLGGCKDSMAGTSKPYIFSPLGWPSRFLVEKPNVVFGFKTLTNVMFSGTARFGRLLSGSIGSPDHLVALTSNHMTAQGENWGSNSASWLSFITLG